MVLQKAFLLSNEWRQRIEREEARLVDLCAWSRCTTARAAAEPDIDPLRSSAGSQLENLNDLDDQAALFANLAFDGRRR